MNAMTIDAHDNALTTLSDEATRVFDAYVEQHLNYGPDLGIIFDAIRHDPEDPYLNAQGAVVHMALEAAEGFRAARPFLDRAAPGLTAGRVTSRERDFIEAAFAFAEADSHLAADILTATARRYPTDVSAAKWAQYHHFNLGQAEGMLAAAEAVLPALEGRPFVHGMHAFALEQMGDFVGAEAEGRRAIEIEREDPWAHHAVAHVMEMQGRVEEGEAFMRALSPIWDKAGIFIREHNWWHIALFLLDQERFDEALAIYDERLWGEWPEFGQEQIGAISALWRMELRGVDVGSRWESVGAKVAEREFEHVQPFHDLHYIYALTRSGETVRAKDFLTSLRANAEIRQNGSRAIWAGTGLPLAEALNAYGEGRFEEAFEAIDPLIPRLQLIGGSHAQRDLFVQSWIDLMVKTGRMSAAREALEKRIEARPEVISTRHQLEKLPG